MAMFPKWFGWAWLACAMAIAPQARAQDVVDAAAFRAEVAKERARPLAPRFPRVAFLAQPVVLGAWLSPDGRQVAYLREAGRNRSVWVVSSHGGAPKRLLAQTEASTLAWSRDARWLFLPSPRQLFALATAGQGGSRAIARLGGTWERAFEGADPWQPDAAIVSESPPLVSRLPKRWRVFRVDAQGRETLLHEDTRQIVQVAFDARGRLAFLVRVEQERYVVHRMREGRPVPALRCGDLARCTLLGATADGREAWLRTDVGANLDRLARLDANDRLQTVETDPRNEADLDDVAFDPATRTPMFARYRSTVVQIHGVTQEAVEHLAAIRSRLPDADLRIEVGRGPDARWLVHDRATSRKGERLHLYDPATGTLHALPIDDSVAYREKPAPALPESAMARKIAFTYRATDGMPIHGFVLLPPGVDATRAPLVVHVHGGPFSLFRPEFTGIGQLLANRGYIVFEPNFRGSTGHGQAYMRAGRGDFGNGRVQRDIVDGVLALRAQGIGDPARVGIMGASFGGYAALQGVTFQPDMFKVGIAAVPPADLGWVLRWYARSPDTMARGIPLATTMRLLDLDPASDAVQQRLRAQSPIANVARLSRPLLLVAGAEDERVPIRSVMHYAAAAAALDRDVSLLVDPNGSHQLPDPRTREAYFYLAETMLHRRLGGAVPEPADPALQTFVERNLRLRGSDLNAPPKRQAASMRSVMPNPAM
jgi:dipeptidyl aminopeptidase/acylaminoacyl peptidase